MSIKKVLERLEAGPLPSSGWAEVAGSPGTLKVLVCRLRARGLNIQTRYPNGRAWKGAGNGAGSHRCVYDLAPLLPSAAKGADHG